MCTELSMSISKLEHEDIASLLGSPALAGVDSLGLHGVTEESACRIAKSAKFVELKRLHFAHNALGDRGLMQFSRLDLSGIEDLSLGNIGCTDRGLTDFLACTRFTKLRSLSISGLPPFPNEISGSILPTLAVALRRSPLRNLSIVNVELPPKICAAFANRRNGTI